MILHLIKKDILLVRRVFFILALLGVGLPLFVLYAAPEVPRVAGFLYAAVLGEIMLMQGVSQEEEKYPKAKGLLCASVCTRRNFVQAKFALLGVMFVYSYVVYTLVMFVAARQSLLSVLEVLFVLLVCAVVVGIYMPIDFKYGCSKARLVFVVVILVASLGPTVLADIFPGIVVNAVKLLTLPQGVLLGGMLQVSVVAVGLSLVLSVKIFSKKEL